MTFLIGVVILGLLASNLVLVRWIVVHSGNVRPTKPIEDKPKKEMAKFGGPPFTVKHK